MGKMKFNSDDLKESLVKTADRARNARVEPEQENAPAPQKPLSSKISGKKGADIGKEAGNRSTEEKGPEIRSIAEEKKSEVILGVKKTHYDMVRVVDPDTGMYTYERKAKENKTHKVTLMIKESMYEDIRAIAAHYNISRNQFIADAIGDALNKYNVKK